MKEPLFPLRHVSLSFCCKAFTRSFTNETQTRKCVLGKVGVGHGLFWEGPPADTSPEAKFKKFSKNPSPRRVLARHSLLDGSVSRPELLFNIIMLIQGDNWSAGFTDNIWANGSVSWSADETNSSNILRTNYGDMNTNEHSRGDFIHSLVRSGAELSVLLLEESLAQTHFFI